MKKLALHWKIIIGMVVGILFGLLMASISQQQIVSDWIKPFGTIFINLLKLIAVPLIIASLIKGIGELNDISKLSKMGFRTLLIYIFTTISAVTVGLVLVNMLKPGNTITETTRNQLVADFEQQASEKILIAESQKEQSPLQPLVDIVPDNIFNAMSHNGDMLKVIFFVLIFSVCLLLIAPHRAKPIKDFIDGLNEVILKMVDLIMLFAPYGVFALMAAIIAESPTIDILKALLSYSLVVVLGLFLMIFIFYPTLVRIFTGKSPGFFFKGISPAQLVAFSTSSSAATLPVTMERVTEHLGVDDDVSSFVLPIGATINMDGTSLYQGVAAVFIAQAFGMDLTIAAQLGIIVTATLASIGSAAVPSAGMIMLVIVLGQAGIPEAGLALIFAVDRPLDMLRTVVNITGDSTVSMIIAKGEGKLREPHEKGLEDYRKLIEKKAE